MYLLITPIPDHPFTESFLLQTPTLPSSICQELPIYSTQHSAWPEGERREANMPPLTRHGYLPRISTVELVILLSCR